MENDVYVALQDLILNKFSTINTQHKTSIMKLLNTYDYKSDAFEYLDDMIMVIEGSIGIGKINAPTRQSWKLQSASMLDLRVNYKL